MFSPGRELFFSRFLFHVHSAVSSIKVPHEVIPSCYLLSILSLLAEKSKGTKPFSEKKKRHKQYMIPAAPSPPGSGCFRRPCDPFGTRTPALLSARCQWRGRSSCTAAFDCRRRRGSPLVYELPSAMLMPRGRTRILSLKSIYHAAPAASMRETARNSTFSGGNAFFPDMVKFAVQVSSAKPDFDGEKSIQA